MQAARAKSVVMPAKLTRLHDVSAGISQFNAVSLQERNALMPTPTGGFQIDRS
jgi:hypothetical protein